MRNSVLTNAPPPLAELLPSLGPVSGAQALSPDDIFRQATRDGLDRAFGRVMSSAPKGKGCLPCSPAQGVIGLASLVLVAAPIITSRVALSGEVEGECAGLLARLPASLRYNRPRWQPVVELWSRPEVRDHRNFLCSELGDAADSTLRVLHQRGSVPAIGTLLTAPRTALALQQWDVFVRFGREHVEELDKVAEFSVRPEYRPLVREWVKRLTSEFTVWLAIPELEEIGYPESFERFRESFTEIGGIERYFSACSSAFRAVFGRMELGRRPEQPATLIEPGPQRVARALLSVGRIGKQEDPGVDSGVAYTQCVEALSQPGVRVDRFEVLLTRCHRDEVQALLSRVGAQKEFLHHISRSIERDTSADDDTLSALITGALGVCRLWEGRIPRAVMLALERTPGAAMLTRLFDVLNLRSLKEPGQVEHLVDLMLGAEQSKRIVSQVLVALAAAETVSDERFVKAMTILRSTPPTPSAAEAARREFEIEIEAFVPWLALAQPSSEGDPSALHSTWIDVVRLATRGHPDPAVSKGGRLFVSLLPGDPLAALVQAGTQSSDDGIRQMARCVSAPGADQTLRKIWRRAVEQDCHDVLVEAVTAKDGDPKRQHLLDALDPQKKVKLADYVAGLASSES